MLDLEDTIVAIASPSSPAIRGIVRLSGPGSVEILRQVGIDIPVTTRAVAIDSSIDLGQPIGAVPARVLIWPTGRSYTGQPSAEIHTFGSMPILTALVESLVHCKARAARPGEFTMRAFLNGRLDLTQAEAVLGVIDAEHRGALDHSLQQLAGNLSRPLETMRGAMLDLLADVEAGLDFVDEDITFIDDDVLIERLQTIATELDQTVEQLRSRQNTASRILITLRGEPNAGKSNLMNALVGHEAAIVADVAGTTRDVVTAEIEIDGQLITIVDTAGIESAQSDDQSGQIIDHAQQLADQATHRADFRLWCVDSSRADFDQAAEQLEQLSQQRRQSAVDVWVATKSDLLERSLPEKWCVTSAQTGAGLCDLKAQIKERLQARDSSETGSTTSTAIRCQGSLIAARDAVSQAILLTQNLEGQEFVSAELRIAVQSLGEVTGAVYNDDILDRVFSRFCIGK